MEEVKNHHELKHVNENLVHDHSTPAIEPGVTIKKNPKKKVLKELKKEVEKKDKKKNKKQKSNIFILVRQSIPVGGSVGRS